MGDKLTIGYVKKAFGAEDYILNSDAYVNNHTKLYYTCPKGHNHVTDWKLWQQGKRCPKCNVKKNNIDNIRNIFTKEGYTLLSDVYINNKSKLQYRCSKGHIGTVTWNDWVGGSRCIICSTNRRVVNRRNTMYSYVKTCLEKEGYTLLSDTYIDNKTKLKYTCPNGHVCAVCWNLWQRGHKCATCATDRLFESNSEKNYLTVKKSFEDAGYILLSPAYRNARHKLDYICPKGHKHSISWYAWKFGRRCPYCAGNIKPTLDHVKDSFEAEGYTLVSNNYINNKTKLDYICKKGHTHSITWTDWNFGYRCPYCAGRGTMAIEDIGNAFKDEKYVLLSTKYKNNKTKLDYVCPEGHTHAITWNDWVGGYRCPSCSHIRLSGPGHPNWKGGVSFEPYCAVWKDKEYKQDIRDRDCNKCCNPCCDSPNAEDLTIHHIDYDKKNCHPNNLITVCRSCNSKANTDRHWHKAWYQTILKNRYGGK